MIVFCKHPKRLQRVSTTSKQIQAESIVEATIEKDLQ